MALRGAISFRPESGIEPQAGGSPPEATLAPGNPSAPLTSEKSAREGQHRPPARRANRPVLRATGRLGVDKAPCPG